MIDISITTYREVINKYLAKLAAFEVDATDFENILHLEFRQREYPNQLNRNGQESDLQHAIRRMGIGKQFLVEQRFQVQNFVQSGDQAVVEALWTGKLALDAGDLRAGQIVNAFFCMIFEFKEGKIFRQRNYDCFEPF